MTKALTRRLRSVGCTVEQHDKCHLSPCPCWCHHDAETPPTAAEPVSLESRYRFCQYCGRQLIEVIESEGWDRQTGQREQVTWMQCPRFPRRSLMALFRGAHDSFSRDRPYHGRSYR